MSSKNYLKKVNLKVLTLTCLLGLGSYIIIYRNNIGSFTVFFQLQTMIERNITNADEVTHSTDPNEVTYSTDRPYSTRFYTRLNSNKIQTDLSKLTLSTKSTKIDSQEKIAVFKNISSPYSKQFLIHLEGCKIPYIDPFNPAYKALLAPAAPIQCPHIPQLIQIQNYTIEINLQIYQKYYSNHELKACSYQSISRDKDGTSDNRFKFGKPIHFYFGSPKLRVLDEYFCVTCKDKNNNVFYDNYYAIILKKPDVEKKVTYNEKACKYCADKKENLSVALIVLDATSTANFHRMCPKTYKFITETLQMIELKVYHKVHDNTLVNIIPFLTGKYLTELGWHQNLKDKSFDKYNYIWKNFSQQGYRTFLSEDYPKIGTFTYLKPGFLKQPVDYYNRPFALAVEQYFLRDRCMGNKLQADALLDYTAEFMSVFQNSKYFAYLITGRLTHDLTNDAATADEPYFKFFKKVKNLLNNTILIFFSDHGSRVGRYRETYFGRLEERLPFLFIYFPPWFKNKYPSLIQNVKINSARLTTHFDMYETLKDILYFDPSTFQRHLSTAPPPRAYSLFNEIPTTRTCKDASIDIQWCACEDFVQADTTNPIVIQAANALVNEINKRIQHLLHLCATLSLGFISDARRSTSEENIVIFNKDLKDQNAKLKGVVINYQLTISVEPSKGLFEGVVSFYKSKNFFEIKSDISRINKYGNQSDCTKEYFLKKYCFCKS